MALSGLRRVLLLGSGYTSAPLLDYLTRDGTVAVTVASNLVEQARELIAPFENTSSTYIDVTSDQSLSALIRNHELVISCVPSRLHPQIAKQCIANKVDMLTSSYVSPALQELDHSAKEAGITLFNEIGLSPGIDHMLAMQCIDETHGKGGKVLSFESFCGGVPAPKYANNPLKYKFSWNLRNVLLETLSSAKYLKAGELVEVPHGGAIMTHTKPVNLHYDDVMPMEGYPEGDSVKYREMYNIPEAHTIICGSLRYKGFCSVVLGLQRLGLLKDTEDSRLLPDAGPLRWKDLMALLICRSDIHASHFHSSALEAVCGDKERAAAIEQLGLLSDDVVPLSSNPLASLCNYLQGKLQYKLMETDVFLTQVFTIEWPDQTKDKLQVDLTHYGIPHSYKAMARCVGKSTAIAAQLILDGKVKEKGIVRPTSAAYYTPILEKLKKDGITAISVQTPLKAKHLF